MVVLKIACSEFACTPCVWVHFQPILLCITLYLIGVPKLAIRVTDCAPYNV